MKTNVKAYLALVGTSLIWGSTWIASKFAVIGTPGLQVSALRQGAAGIIYTIFFLLKGEKLPTKNQFKYIFINSFFLLIIANSFSTWGIKYVSSGLAALIGALYPLFVVLLEWMWFKKKNNSKTYLGIAIGLLGISVVFYKNSFEQHSDNYVWGIVLGLTATLS